MKNWNNMTWEEKNSNFQTIAETYNSYADAETFAYNVRMGYENDPEWFGFEVTDMEQFESDLIEIFNDKGEAVTATGKGIDNVEVNKSGVGYNLTYTVNGKPVCVTGEFFVDKQGYLHHEDAITGEEIKVKVINTNTVYYICMVVGDKYTYVATESDVEKGGFTDADPDNFSFPTREEAEATLFGLEAFAASQGYDNARFTIEEVEN